MGKKVPCSVCEHKYPESLIKDNKCTHCRSDERHELRNEARIKREKAAQKEIEERAAKAERHSTEGKAVTEPALDIALAARRERAKRELCRRHLLPFVQRFNPSYDAGWVHKDICERLERFSQQVANKESPRLMIFMPPRHGKSELASRMFPAWHLGHYPEQEVIACSYASSLALKFSRKVRSVVGEKNYQQLFPQVKLDPENKAAECWMTNKGGSYMAAGVSGPLTGNGMHIGIIDDPVKNREEAESENVRESIKDWYTSTFYTRLAPGAGILVILTRWHDSDLAGWLLEQEKHGGDKWEVIKYPAIAEHDERFRNSGQALHPQRYDLKSLQKIKNAVGPRDWEALYQQNPVALDGDYFKKDMIRYHRAAERPPLDELKTYTCWDLAIGTKEHNDYSVGVTVGIDIKENIWLLDVQRGRWGALELVELILDTYDRWQPERVGIEKGHIEMTLGPFLRKRIRERRCYGFNYEELKTGRKDKAARARPIQGRMQQGMVLFPEDAPWVQTLVNELLRFPNGKHDDQVDALAWIGQLVDTFAIYIKPKPKPKPSWRDRISRTSVGKHRSAMAS